MLAANNVLIWIQNWIPWQHWGSEKRSLQFFLSKSGLGVRGSREKKADGSLGFAGENVF